MNIETSTLSPRRPNLRFAVIGMGALGGYYGGLLARSGHEVHFLARSNFEAVASGGLYIESAGGDFWLQRVNVHARAEDMPRCEVVLVALKATDNAALDGILNHVLAEGGTTILIQNGLGQEERLPRAALEGSVYAGLAFICAFKAAPNRVVHQDYGTLRLAAFRESEPAMRRHGGLAGIAQAFVEAGINIECEPEFLGARWKKLVWNIPFNGLSVALRANTEELLAGPSSRDLVRTLMLEVIAAAQAEGCALEPSFAEEMIEGTQRMKPYYPSMHGDYLAGRPLELEAMYRVPVQRARRAGSAMVRVEMLTSELEFLVARRTATSTAPSFPSPQRKQSAQPPTDRASSATPSAWGAPLEFNPPPPPRVAPPGFGSLPAAAAPQVGAPPGFGPPAAAAAPPPDSAPPSVAPATPLARPVVDNDVQFTVYRPEVIPPLVWKTLLVFVHKGKRASSNEPDPVAIVAERAQRTLGEDSVEYASTRQDAPLGIPRESEITLVPQAPGVEFNPREHRFTWLEPVHQIEFRMRSVQPEERSVFGGIRVFVGVLLVAEVPLKLEVAEGTAREALKPASTGPLKRVFPSYSHADAAIVALCERCAEALGFEYLRDVRLLRAGEQWSDRIEQLIREANVFQLFWSHNAMRSPYVRAEWELALAMGKSMCPVYWEHPFPESPQQNLPPSALRALHFVDLSGQRRAAEFGAIGGGSDWTKELLSTPGVEVANSIQDSQFAARSTHAIAPAPIPTTSAGNGAPAAPPASSPSLDVFRQKPLGVRRFGAKRLYLAIVFVGCLVASLLAAIATWLGD